MSETNKMVEAETETPVKERTREARKLYWYERQYGSGWICGFWIGVAVGTPLAMLLAAICKRFLDWLFAF